MDKPTRYSTNMKEKFLPQQAALMPSWHGVYPKEMFENAFVIGLAGLAGSGKTTISEQIMNELKQDSPSIAILSLSFSGRLKEVLAALIGEDMSFEAQEEKAALLYAGGNWTARDFLLAFGTEFIRDQIGADFWVDVIAKKLAQLECPTIVLIDSLRYPNELKLIQSLGVAVLIKRAGIDKVIKHRSEEPDKLAIKLVINNDDTPRRAAQEILKIVQQRKDWPK